MSWTTERWAQIERVFHAVAPVEPAARGAHLDQLCGDDHELRDAVQSLLAADDPAEDAWLDVGVTGPSHGDELPRGTRVGPFELVERIAEGGMGTVWRGRRVDADFAQEVAVKLLRLGLSTPADRERFARERQTLARLVHPNVARLLDGGTTPAGMPYFAMEFVDGVPLDRFADAHRLSVRARVQLLVAVCRAVQFAHQNLVVHLDLKPNNILVDAHGIPKLLDFGVAGLLSDLAGGGEVAATRSRPLTPEYASPEQLRGEPVGTAADVWALGVVLYELLVGRRPFLVHRGDAALLRSVLDTEAPRPSTACCGEDGPTPTASVRAAHRAATPRELQRCLRGDLDRVIAMAMAKDPQRRYASCQDLAADLERWLAGYPVLAREPSVAYRVGKFVQRNRALVAASTLAVASLLFGTAAALHAARVARIERDAAAAALARAEHDAGHARIEATSNHLVAEFLGETFLASGLVDAGPERDRLLATIEQRAGQVRRQHADGPHLRANLLHALGRAALAIDEFASAAALLREAADIRREHFGEHSLEFALSLGSLGQLHYRQGRLDDAATALREAHRLHCTCPPDVHTDVALAANDLAAVERALGNTAAAQQLHEAALALRRQGGDLLLVAESLNNLANAEADRGKAREYLQESHRLRQQILGDQHPLTVQSLANLGAQAIASREFAAARDLLVAAAAGARALGARGEDGLAITLRSLAYAERRLGDLPAAEAAITEALASDRRRFGNDHLRVAGDLEVLADVLEARGQTGPALAAWQEVLAIRERTLPPGHRQLGQTRLSIGGILLRRGDAAASLQQLDALVAAWTTATQPAPTDLVDCHRLRAEALARLARWDEGEQALREAAAAVAAGGVDAARAEAVAQAQRQWATRRPR